MEPNHIRLPGWTIGKELGKGGFGSVYQISRDVLGTVEYNALKVISIPHESGQIELMRLSGMNDASIVAHLKSQVKSFLDEYSIMQVLQDNPHIVRCYDFQHIPHQDNFSWTIMIRMELLTPLLKAMDKVSTEDQIIQLALDMCSALMACQEHNIIHRDIKPQNIFVAKNGSFKLGDFGISKILDSSTSAHTQIGTMMFIAPEIVMGKSYNSTVDIYSLGLMLYWFLNNRKAPFMSQDTPNFGENQQALTRRLQGEALPSPVHGSRGLKQIVLKACSFRPEDRYQSAREMQQALRALRSKKDIPVPPEPVSYVISSARGTGLTSYICFLGLDPFASVHQPVLPYFSLEIGCNRLRLSHKMPQGLNQLPAARDLLTDDGKVYASFSGHKHGRSTISCQNRLYTVIIGSTGWEIQSDGKTIATITDLKKAPPKWTPLEKKLFNDPLQGLSARYQMFATSDISSELALVFLCYPLLEYPAPEKQNTPKFTPPAAHSFHLLVGSPPSAEMKYRYERDHQLIAEAIAGPDPGDFSLSIHGKPVSVKKRAGLLELRWSSGSLLGIISEDRNGQSTIYCMGKQYRVAACSAGWELTLEGKHIVTLLDQRENSHSIEDFPATFPTYHFHGICRTDQKVDIADELAILLLTYPLMDFPVPRSIPESESINDSLPSEYALVATSGTGDTRSYVYLYHHSNIAAVLQHGYGKNETLDILINGKYSAAGSSQEKRLTYAWESSNPDYRILRRQDKSIFAAVSGCRDGKSCIFYGNTKYILTSCGNGWNIRIGKQHLASIRAKQTNYPHGRGDTMPTAFYLHSQPGFPEELALLLLTYPLLEFPASPYAVVDLTDISDITNGRTLNPDDILVNGIVGNLGAVEILLKTNHIRKVEDLQSCSADTLNDLVRAVQQSVSSLPYLAAAELLLYRMKYQTFPLYYEENMKLCRGEMYSGISLEHGHAFPCRINDGPAVDLSPLAGMLPADFAKLETTEKFLDRLAQVTKLTNRDDLMNLACRILSTGEIPDSFHTRKDPAIPSKLDIYTSLELKYQPRGKDRKQVVSAEGRSIQVTLPSKSFGSTPEDIVVKNAGHTDPVTGKTGDAHIMVSCKGIFYRPNSLLNLVLDLFILILAVIYIAVTVVKDLVTTKLFWIVAAIVTLVYVVQHFFLT